MPFDINNILIVVAILAVLILAFLVMRRRPTPIERKPAEPYVASRDRPYMKHAHGAAEGNGVTGEVAAATTDVAGEVLGVEAHRHLSGAPPGPADDLVLLKGVGHKLAARLNELGITRFAQIAGMNETELAHLDERMGPFRGRLERDRIAEQADYLARGDIESFEEKFGKLGSET
jgi:predicted flap endonuclease-1-like 5' DNA nuclease